MPNPTTINEDQPMNISETITKLRKLLAKATPGEWAAGHFGTDYICQCSYVLSETCMGSICDVSVNNGKLIADGGNDAPPANEAVANLQLIPAMKNALPQLLDALEAWESEKPKKWWTVGEKMPPEGWTVLLWHEQCREWMTVTPFPGYWHKIQTLDRYDMLRTDIWSFMPPAPFIGESK